MKKTASGRKIIPPTHKDDALSEKRKGEGRRMKGKIEYKKEDSVAR